MHPVLERVLAGIDKETAGLGPADLERHPPGTWSCAASLEHLSLSFDGTCRNLQKCLDIGARRATHAQWWQRLGVLLVVELGYFPRGGKAPAPTLPKGLPGQAALDAVRRNLHAMDAVMADCEKRFAWKGKIADHPILGPLSLRQWRRFHWIHTRHHLKQIARRSKLDRQ